MTLKNNTHTHKKEAVVNLNFLKAFSFQKEEKITPKKKFWKNIVTARKASICMNIFFYCNKVVLVVQLL